MLRICRISYKLCFYQHPHTVESINNLIDLNEAWNKQEEAEKRRAKLPHTEAVEE